MQTEVIDEDGTDCETDKTLEIDITENNANDYIHRNIKVNGKPVLLEPDDVKKYIGKKIHVYSPMFCCGDKLCSKCVGKYGNKFIGLDTSKVATTLTNLNMKKFHDNTIKLERVDTNDLLYLNKKKDIFSTKNGSVVLNDTYCEIYIPMFYFDKNYRFSENLGDKISTFGIVNVGVFTSGKLTYIDLMKMPSWIDLHVYDSEIRDINLPAFGITSCKVIKYFKGNEIFNDSLVVDSENAQTYLRFITFGKLPNSIPYSKTFQTWMKNQNMNHVNFGVSPLILEVILAVAYRYKENNAIKFAKIIGKPDSKVSEYDYNMASIRSICQYSSTFSAITFEDMDSMITASINRLRDKKEESESPVEALFKL